jgi:putative PIN family toxin of toxin-antitoxin system
MNTEYPMQWRRATAHLGSWTRAKCLPRTAPAPHGALPDETTIAYGSRVANGTREAHITGDMRLVLDTNVLVTAFLSRRGAAAELVRLIRRGELTMVATVALFLEYEAVLTRPEHLARAEMTVVEAEDVLDVLAAVVEPVEPHFLWRPRSRDPDDDMVIEAAANGRADAIATFNARDFAGLVDEFRIEVLTPVEILKRLVT